MWKTNMVRFRPLILHDITWGCLTKWNPKPPWHIITHWNSKFGARPILRQTWQWRYGHPSRNGSLHLYPPDIHPIDNIPPFGGKNTGTCRRSGSTPLHGTRQISATAAYLWTHLGTTEASEVPTTCGHIMALLSYLPLSQWKAPGTMFNGKVPWRKSTIINDQTWDLTNNGNRMGTVYGMPFTAGYFVGNGRDGPQSIGGTLRKPHYSESPRIMGHTPAALGPH